MSKTVLFTDSQVTDYETLLTGLGSNVKVHSLNAKEDGVLQMAAILKSRTELDSIQIISHGSSGSLSLGASILNHDNLSLYQNALKQIGSSLSATGDILLYGCNVAHGEIGSSFINRLAQYTGAEVAASDDLTGNAAFAGDWHLESQTGSIEALPALNSAGIAAYHSTLEIIQGTSGDDSLYGDIGNDTLTGGTGNDYLWGGEGADIYVINKGDGKDEIDNVHADSSVDIVSFANLLPSDITKAARDLSSDNLTFTYGISQLTLQGYFREGWYYTNPNGSHTPIDYKVNQFQFSDGTVWSFNDAAIAKKLSPLQGTAGNDYIEGYSNWSETINGLEGNDNLYGGDGNDTLNGGGGNDYIEGGIGNDILNGNAGDDILYGDEGNNQIYAGIGNDSLYGGIGNDVLNGGTGKDTLQGDGGDDIYYVDNLNDKIVDSAGNDTVYISVDGYRLPTGIENVIYQQGARPLPYFINALDSGYHWGGVGQALSLTYSFATVADGTKGFALYTAEQQTAVRNALAKYSDISGLTFTETTDSAAVQLRFFRDDLTSANSGSYAGYTYYPSGGDVHINTNQPDLSLGQNGFEVLLHEIGHGLGLKHSFSTPALDVVEDNTNNTVMSYTWGENYNPVDISMFDKAAIHYLYGVKTSAKSGNNTYHFADRYIWDGAGGDSFSAAEQTQSVYLNLKAGSWIYAGAKNDSILASNQAFIGYGTVIENAIGGTGNDILEGNNSTNALNGNKGADTMKGGLGNDLYIVDNIGDIVIETSTLATEIDRVNSSISYTLKANLENLTLTGTAALSGTGNALKNSLTGNAAANVLNGAGGNDILIGGAGNDVLTGGVGKDFFRLTTLSKDTVTDFVAVDDTLQLENAVFTKLTTTGVLSVANFKIGTAAADANDYIVYNSGTGALLYDADGNGTGAAVQIALIGATTHAALTVADFVVI